MVRAESVAQAPRAPRPDVLREARAYFARYDAHLRAEWARHAERPSAFPAAAARALALAPMHREPWSIRALLEALVVAPDHELAGLPLNHQPSVMVVHAAPDYVVSLTFSHDQVVPYHHHSWSGAIQVVEGLSVTSEAAWREHEAIEPDFTFGHLEPTRAVVLRPGDTVPLHAGEAFVHGVIHLVRPTVTMTVRRQHSIQIPTCTYWGRALRAATLPSDAVVVRALDTARARTTRLGPEARRALLLDTLSDCRSTREAFYLCQLALKHAVRGHELVAAVSRHFDRWDTLGAMLERAIIDLWRSEVLGRARVHHPSAATRGALSVAYFAETPEVARALGEAAGLGAEAPLDAALEEVTRVVESFEGPRAGWPARLFPWVPLRPQGAAP